MRRFILEHLGLIFACIFFVLGSLLSLHLSAEADRRLERDMLFQERWKQDETAWFDSNMVQSARADSLVQAIIDTLVAMQARAAYERSLLLEK